MPRTVNFGDYYGTVSFPDDATDNDVVAHYNELESQRNRAVQLSKLQLERATDEVELQQPTFGKIATLAGLNLREGAAGTTEQVVGNVARTFSDIISEPKPGEGFSVRQAIRQVLIPMPGDELLKATASDDPEATVNVLREAGKDVAQRGDERLKEAQELSEGVGGGLPGKVTASIASTAGASAPALLAAPLGLPVAALASGVQSYGSNLSSFKEMIQARNPNLTEEEAFQQAQVPAAITGAATAVLTRTFGGVERFVDRIAKEGLKQTGVKALLRESFKNASLEMPEEGLDQLAQGLTEKALINPDKDIGEILNEAGMAGLTGFALGGITTGAIAAPVKAAETAAGAIESSRVRRQSARESEERVKQVIQEREKQDASQAGTPVTPPSQEEAPVKEEVGGVRVRDTAQDGVEAETGAVAPKEASFGGYQYGLPMYTIPGVRPGIVRHVSAETAQKAGYTVPATIPTMKEWQAGSVDTVAKAPAQATPEQVASDVQAYNSVQAKILGVIRGGGDTSSPEFQALWKENETIKNRHGGMPPVLPAVSQATPAAPTTPQEQAQAPINWQEFTTRDSEGYNAIDPAKIREQLITGKIQGGTVNNQLLTYLLRDSSLHPLNPIRLIDLGPQQLQAISPTASPAGEGAYRGLFTTRTLSDRGNIEILTQNSDGTPVSQAAFVQTLAHELVHNNVTSKINQASPELRKEVNDFYKWVTDNSQGTEWVGQNALKDVYEFFSEGMTDPRFQQYLSNLDYGSTGKAKIKRSAFSAFMDLIKRIFRLPDFIISATGQKVSTVTALEQLFSLAGELEQVQRYSQQALMSMRAPVEESTFKTRQQVEALAANPGLDAAQQQEVRDLAAVQSSMSPDNLALWLMGSPANEAEGFAQRKLAYIEDRRYLSDLQRDLASMPEATPEEIRAKEVAGAAILGHYGVDRSVLREADADLEKAQNQMALAAKKITGLNNNQLKANFLTALFNHLTSDYRTYLGNLAQTLPASQNAQALYRQRLADAERRLNEHEQSPIAIQRALSALAAVMPTNLTANQQVIEWELRNNSTMGVVSDNVRIWMFIDDGSGSPALLGYTRLLQDMSDLRDVLAHQGTLASEIDSFEKWFRTSGQAGKVSAKSFAEKYFKLRTSRDRAMKVAAAIDKEINDLDTRIHGNIIAGDKLRELMAGPAYVETVRDAAQRAHVVVRAIHEQGEKNGLIERDKTVGQWKMTGPVTGQEYVVDLHPSSSEEASNRGKLKAFAQEARDYSVTNSQTDPLLADEYENLADYIDKYLVHPALDPSQGFTQLPWINVPGTNIRVTTDPFAWTAKTVRDTLEKIGGRSVRQAVLDAAELDTVMQQVQGINQNPEYGYAAQTQAILAALTSHNWSTELFPEWDEKIAEKVLASGQNNVSPLYQAGDIVVGSGEVLTSEDIKAMRIMKRWEDAVLAVAPKHIKDRIADLGIVRKAVGNGKYTMARTAAPWVQNFMLNWNKATTDADKLKLLENDTLFQRIVLGYVSEFNPEFAKMNPASKDKTPLFEIFRRMARLEKEGVQSFSNLNDVLDFTAGEMVSRNMASDHVTAKAKAGEMLLTDIKNFIGSFQENVLNKKTEDVWGDVPPAVVQASSANNSFTIPRGALVAPSTFYSYSTASDGRRAVHVGSLRSFLNLKLLQSGYEARRALEAKKSEMDDRIKELLRSGKTKAQAREIVIKETARSRKASEIQFDYLEINHALGLLEKTFDQLERFESSTTEHYQHGGVAALMNVFGTLKSFLLSSPQAVTTNYWSGVMLGPAIAHLQTGRIGRALSDFVIEPHFWGTIYRRLSAAVAGNPVMASLLKKHAPLWNSFSKEILTAAEDWRRIEEIAQNSGMVSPYNLKQNLANRKALASTGGRLESAEEMATLRQSTETVNTILGSGRHVVERVKATTPRLFDNFINYALITAFEYETDFLKKMGWVAFKNREEQADKTGANWADLSDPDNVLTPGDLRLGTSKALNRYREWFSGIGSLDQVLLDFYERTKSMTPEQRREEPLIRDPAEHAAVALQYAATTNVATETNRPYLFKGKGSDGLWRNVAGTFMGWPINMAKQLSKAIQSHSKDPQFTSIASNMIGLAMLVMLFSLGGAWNWEFGDELTELLFNQSSARIQPGNVMRAAKEGDLETAAMYFVQGLVNTVPLIGGAIGNLAGVAYTGRGNLFDMSSWNPVLGWISDTWNTGKRIIQTGDVTLPMLDYARRWVPLSKVAINRLPLMRGLVDQQNAVRSLNASAPPGTEIVWGQGGMGALRYGPANDEIQKLIASAYEAVAHGGSLEQVEQRRADAIAAFVRAGRTEEDATKAVDAALAAKEPIRVLTGKEFTEEEAARWVARMTPAQKKDYDRATAAWEVLGAVTGKDLNMVATARGSGGGGGIPGIAALSAGIPSIGQGTSAAMPRMASQAPARGYSGYLRQPSLGGSRVRSPLGRRRTGGRSMRIRRRRVGATRRRLGPRIARSRVRRVLGTRRRRSYAAA